MTTLLLTLMACGDVEPQDVTTLEDLSAEIAGCDTEAGCASDGTLAIGVGDEDGDWTIAVGEHSVAVHAPGRSDLSGLDGLTGTLHTGEWVWNATSTVAVEDEQGLAWLLAGTAEDPLVATFLSADFARWDTEVAGKGSEGDYNLAYHDVVFATDDGDVTVASGAPTVLKVGGASYRVVVIASYDAELKPTAMATDCGGMSDMLAFEVERVATEEEEAPLTRPAGKAIAADGCGG